MRRATPPPCRRSGGRFIRSYPQREIAPLAQPIFKWPGGKRRLARHILPHFNSPHQCYVEPFAGAAAMLFARDEPAAVEVLNDVNRDLVNLYRVVQHHLDEFVRQFRWALTSRQVFEWAKLQHPDTLTDIQRAARFFWLQQHAFGGKVSGRTFGTSTTSKVGVNLLRLEETLSEAHLRLNQVIVECLPWEECIAKYDRPHTLFFLDPPYWQTEGYGVDFEFDQYERLAESMATMKGTAVLTVNDHPDMRQVFARFEIERVGIRYTLGGRGASKQAGELIIRSR